MASLDAVRDLLERVRLGSSRRQVRMVWEGSEDVRSEIARSPHISKAAMLEVLRTGDKELIAFLACNGSIPEDVQKMIYRLVDAPMYSLSRNVNLSPGMQLRLAYCRDLPAQGLALNLGVTLEAQHLLAGSTEFAVRMALAINPNLDPKVQVRLSFDENRTVHYNLVRNDNLVKTPLMSARFLRSHDMVMYREVVGPERWETAQDLMSNWSGSLTDLVKACDLVSI